MIVPVAVIGHVADREGRGIDIRRTAPPASRREPYFADEIEVALVVGGQPKIAPVP